MDGLGKLVRTYSRRTTPADARVEVSRARHRHHEPSYVVSGRARLSLQLHDNYGGAAAHEACQGISTAFGW